MLNAPERRATKKLAKIFLPEGNLDFDQFLRYFSSAWFKPQLRRNALNLIQNQDFNLGDNNVKKPLKQVPHIIYRLK